MIMYISGSGFTSHTHHFIHDFLLGPPANEPDPEIPIGSDIGQVCPLGHGAVQYIPRLMHALYER